MRFLPSRKYSGNQAPYQQATKPRNEGPSSSPASSVSPFSPPLHGLLPSSALSQFSSLVLLMPPPSPSIIISHPPPPSPPPTPPLPPPAPLFSAPPNAPPPLQSPRHNGRPPDPARDKLYPLPALYVPPTFSPYVERQRTKNQAVILGQERKKLAPLPVGVGPEERGQGG